MSFTLPIFLRRSLAAPLGILPGNWLTIITVIDFDLPLVLGLEVDFFCRCCSATTQSSVGSNFLFFPLEQAGNKPANTFALASDGFPSFLHVSFAFLVEEMIL